MIIGIIATTFFLFTYFVLQPWKQKPLYPDDGNWFYYAKFKENGLKLHKNFFNSLGYFGVQWFYSILCRKRTAKEFYNLKIIWYSLTNSALIVLSFLFFKNLIAPTICGIFFLLIVMHPKTSFILTFAEHFLILPILLEFIAIFLGITYEINSLFFIAGIFASIASHIKIVSLPASFLTLIFLCFVKPLGIPVSLWSIGFLIIHTIPFLILDSKEQRKEYVFRSIHPIITVLNGVAYAIDSKLMINLVQKITFSKKEVDSKYEEKVVAKNSSKIFNEWKIYWQPIWRVFPLLIPTTILYFIFGVKDINYALVSLLMISMISMQFVQKSFFPGHSNQIWIPIILAASGALSHLFMIDYLILQIVLSLLILQSLILTIIDFYEVNKSSEKAFIPNYGKKYSMYFDYARQAGNWISQKGSSKEKMLVWGNLPTLYLYANKQILNPFFTHLYPRNELHAAINTIFEQLETTPPEWIVFIQKCTKKDDWNFQKLTQYLNVDYQLVHKIDVKWNGKIIDQIPIYRRNDTNYRALLLEKNKILSEEISKEYEWRSSNEIEYWNNLFNKDFSKINEMIQENKLNENQTLYAMSIQDIESQNFDFAEDKLMTILQSEPNNYRACLRLGEIAFNRGQTSYASDFFNKAIKINPASPEAFNNLGVLSFMIQQPEKAIFYLQKSLKLCPEYKEAQTNLAHLTGVAQ